MSDMCRVNLLEQEHPAVGLVSKKHRQPENNAKVGKTALDHKSTQFYNTIEWGQSCN